MLNENQDDAARFLFQYFKTSPNGENSIERLEDKFTDDFQNSHDKIDKETKKLCEMYNEMSDLIGRIHYHECVLCKSGKKGEAIYASTICGHILFCRNCRETLQSKFEQNMQLRCPVCQELADLYPKQKFPSESINTMDQIVEIHEPKTKKRDDPLLDF